jgi:MFS transporter, SHS family, lactate transporter
MESWPVRSRGVMSGILQGSLGIGFALSSLVYGVFYGYIGWRGMLWVGVLPAFAVLYVRRYVKEPQVWVENRRQQRIQHREVRAPLFKIFRRGLLTNTLTACWWMASSFILYYSLIAMFATHLQKDLNLSPALVATPVLLFNLLVFFATSFWGWTGDRLGRRWAMIIPSAIAVFIAPLAMQANPEVIALPGNGPHVYPSRSLADDGHVSWGLGFARLRYVGLRKN